MRGIGQLVMQTAWPRMKHVHSTRRKPRAKRMRQIEQGLCQHTPATEDHAAIASALGIKLKVMFHVLWRSGLFCYSILEAHELSVCSCLVWRERNVARLHGRFDYIFFEESGPSEHDGRGGHGGWGN